MDVLDAIDRVVDDWTISGDAMRCASTTDDADRLAQRLERPSLRPFVDFGPVGLDTAALRQALLAATASLEDVRRRCRDRA
ncbi:MAG: hypothetical protein LC640_09395 [Frankia sp.]|nr:hypothetical protein [Frankia sp.]